MDKVRKPNISVCYTPSSELYSIYIRLQFTGILFVDLEKSFYNLQLKSILEDSMLIADSEKNLQRILHHFMLSRHKYHTKILVSKTKVFSVSKEPLRCNLR
jgi:hypothetical protein